MLHRNFCDSLQSRPDKVLGGITGGLAASIPFTMLGKVGSTISKIDKLVPDEVIGANNINKTGVNDIKFLTDTRGLRENPLLGTKYTNKVLQQMKLNDFHSFPLEVDNFGNYASKTLIKGGDGIVRTRVEIPGFYKGKQGVFQYIIEPNNSINHWLFVPLNQ